MIVLFTDFGWNGPYVGQLHAALALAAPDERVIDLMHDVSRHAVRAAAYLLPSLVEAFPKDTVFLCVVDPGVGSERRAVAMRADDRWYVGPDNGLFQIVEQRAARVECHEILWRPPHLSTSFHGRDLFAPVAAALSKGKLPESRLLTPTSRQAATWPDCLAEVIYIDAFGNAMTGLLAERADKRCTLLVHGRDLAYATTFSAVAHGYAFWYCNSSGLVEIAVNQGSAADLLGLRVGDPLELR